MTHHRPALPAEAAEPVVTLAVVKETLASAWQIVRPPGLNNMHFVRQPTQHRTGQSLRTANLRPVLERQVRRDNQTLLFKGSAC